MGDVWLAGLMAANGVFALRTYTANSTNVNGAGGMSAVMFNLKRDVVYHAVVVYDPDDSSRQFVAVNTDKTPLLTTNSPLVTFNGARYGDGSADNVTIQDVFFLSGKAVNDDEIKLLAGDVSETKKFVESNDFSGTFSFYHSLDGTPGDSVKSGDAGISWPSLNGVPGTRLPSLWNCSQ